MYHTVMDELVACIWILLSFKANLSHGVTCTSNNYTCNGKCCSYPDVSEKAVVTSWYIWVAVFCGLMLLGTISGIHMRMKHSKSRVAFLASQNQRGAMVQPTQAPRQPVRRQMFIQPASTYTNPGLGNPFYRPALMPLRPPPYSPAQPPPPPYQMPGGLPRSTVPPQLLSPCSNREEKDESMALSMIQPMQPAYIMPDAYGPLQFNPPYTHPTPNSAGAPPGRLQVIETHHI